MSDDIKQLAETVITRTYNRLPLVITRGKGATLWDENGRAYTDFLAGIAVCNLGHAHPGVAAALAAQAGELFHVSNLFYTIPQTELAAALVKKSFADRVFFCNSGAEANEAAIKLARKYFSDRGEPQRHRIIAMTRSFHGRTMATLSATGQDKIKTGFAPLLEGFDFTPFNDLEALAAAVTPATCAVMLEPIQGEGGVICPTPGYLAGVRRLCVEHDLLLIFDEVQTGMGRTGRLFAYEHENVSPDIMTLAKALGNGLPIGVMLATEKAAAAFVHGSHASTFGGTPVICAAALAVLNIIDQEQILDKCRTTGDYFMAKLCRLKERHPVVKEIRGRGLLLGMALDRPGGPIVTACLEQGYIINCVQDTVLRFAPPLIISPQEIDGLTDCLDRILSDN